MTQLELELQLCKERFDFFVGYCFFHMFKTKFIFYKFHRDIIDILVNLNEHPRSIINAPPRIGKTELVKHYIAWLFLRNPSSSVIYVSYEERLVARKNREIRDLLKWLAKHFGIRDLEITSQSNGKTEWVNRANGTILARGSNNGITGAGCSTLLVLDDPNKPNDRSSPVILEQRNKTFTNTIRNRINTPETPILIVQQRIASLDLSGFLLAGGSNEKWEHFNFPAINEDGTALCPERLPLEEIETYKNDPFTYNAQYLQVPLDDVGKLFDKNKILLAASHPPLKDMRLVISIDASGKGDIGNDFNAISVIGRTQTDYYVLEIQNFRADITVLLQRCRELRSRYGSNIPFLFESRANGQAAVQLLRKEMSGILETNPCKDKVERAIVVKYLFDAMNVQFCIRGLVWGEVQSQFTQFPHCKHDDIVDSVVQGITWLQNLPMSKQADDNNKNMSAMLHRKTYGGQSHGIIGYNPSRGIR